MRKGLGRIWALGAGVALREQKFVGEGAENQHARRVRSQRKPCASNRHRPSSRNPFFPFTTPLVHCNAKF